MRRGAAEGPLPGVRRIGRNARILAAAVVLLLLAGGLAFGWLSHQRVWEAASRQADGLADRHAVLLSFLLDGIEEALQDSRVAPAGAGESGGSPRSQEGLPRIGVFALDRQGRPARADRARLLPPPEQLAEGLARAAAKPGRTRMLTPYPLGDELWSLGLLQPPGAAGFLAAPFRLDPMLGLWDELDEFEGTLIAVLDQEDRLWLRHPLQDGWLGRDLSSLEAVQAVRAGHQRAGQLRLRYPAAGAPERFFAWRLVEPGGMLVAAGVPVAGIRAAWIERFLPAALLTFVLSLAAVAAVWSYSRDVLAQAREREAALQALAESEARFRDFADSSSDWFWETDESHRFTFLSERIGSLLGVPSGSLLGRKRSALVGGVLDEALYRHHLADLQARRPFRDFVYQVRLESGRRWVKVSGKPRFDAEGRFLGYRGTGTDIDAQHTIAERAETLHRRLVEAFEASLDGIALFDADDRLILANEHYKRLFFPGHEALVQPGLHFDELVERLTHSGRPPLATRDGDAWRALGERGARGEQELSFQLSDGRWLQLRERVTARGDYFRVFSDISAFKQREEELHQTKETAELANRSKSEFLAVMSHELRTPLNAIIGFSDILQGEMFGPIGSARYRDYAHHIHLSGRHLLEVINDILDLSKAEAGKLELQEEEVALDELVARATAMVQPRAEEARVRLSASLPPGPPRLRADRRKLLQMLLNLLSNAVKFTPPGGRVAVTAGLTAEGLALLVEDSGIGIAREDLARVQEPFIQLASVLTRQREGTGLGLPLAKRLAELHGGSLEIESEPGRGTRVRVRLPPERLLPPVAA